MTPKASNANPYPNLFQPAHVNLCPESSRLGTDLVTCDAGLTFGSIIGGALSKPTEELGCMANWAQLRR